MPGACRWSLDGLVEGRWAGLTRIRCVVLFPKLAMASKARTVLSVSQKAGLIPRAIRRLKLEHRRGGHGPTLALDPLLRDA